MKIYNSQNKLILEVEVDDNSYRNRAIMGDHALTLYYSLAEHVELPIGAYTDYEGERYYLLLREAFKMKHSRYFEYTVTMQSDQGKASIWKFRNPVDGRLKFSLTAKPIEHLQMLVDNLNMRDPGWTVGECIEDKEHLISYDHAYCIDALSQMASEFDTEYEFNNKVVSLRKIEHNKNYPLALSYGRGNGFKPNIGRSNSSDTPPVEILFVQGGDTNIDRSKYPTDETLRATSNGCLLLPVGGTLGYDGVKFEDEDGYNEAEARHYIVDDLGLSIRNIDHTPVLNADDSLDRSDDYPKRIGTVTDVVCVDEENNFWDFIDNTIPEDLEYNDYLIDEENMTVIFQSGELASRELEVKYIHKAKTVNGVQKQARRFEIVPQEIDGVTMPGDTFIPKKGDTYAIFNVMLPQAYINAYTGDNPKKEGAEWDMFRAAVKYLFENEEQKFSFSGELDGIWAKKDWNNIGAKIVLGGYIKFSDDRFQQDGVLVRITGIKDYINKPHSPKIELSNDTITPGFTTTMQTLESQEVLVEDYHREALQYTKRRFRDAKETMEMIQSALSDNFTNSINPVTIETMQMLVGDERLQYQFVKSATNPTPVAHNITWDSELKQLRAPAGIIQHQTLGISSLSSSHKAAEYHYWSAVAWMSAYLDDTSQKYYLYLKATNTQSAGSVGTAEFRLETEAHDFDGGDCYWLLVGVLNSEYEGERSFVTLYGFTEVLPGRITTDRIASGTGTSYFDMLNNAMKLGDVFDFNSDGNGQLRLKGTIVQSQGGEAESPIGCYRGVYNNAYTYYTGDEVTYQESADLPLSTYRRIGDTPTTGIAPTNTLYWTVIAQGVAGETGADGKDGKDGVDGKDGISPNASFKSTVFIRTNTQPATPTGGSWSNPVPTGWSDGIPSGEAKLWASTRIFSSDGNDPQQDSWTTPQQMTDTADFDVEYSSETAPSAPKGHPNTNTEWSNDADEDTIWMATSRKSNGVWEDWQVSRIKGENGADGTSIKVKGSFKERFDTRADFLAQSSITRPAFYLIDYDEELDAYCVVAYASKRILMGKGYVTTYEKAEDGDAYLYLTDGHLYLANDDHWEDIGQFKGDKGDTGAAGENAYVHIKYANSLEENDWTDNDGETPGDYIGIYTDNNPEDQLDWSLYQWKKWRGEDGFGYEYIYKRTTTEEAPTTPTQMSMSDDFVPTGWTDDPTGVDEDNQYEWVCYRKKTSGVWGKFIGSASDNSKAALWAKFGATGETGATGAAGNFTEYRYAFNGSTTTPPTLNTESPNPVGWSTTMPQLPPVSVGYYIWMTKAVKSGDGTKLISNWSTPVRISPYDGIDGKDGADGKDGSNGKSPVMVYRGIYSSSKTYYGNDNRLDVVKLNDTYYIARIDAGEFSQPAPPDTSKWNSFGASFESVATNLLLAEGANIGDWFISGGKIVSTLDTGDIIILDAKNNLIQVKSSTTDATYNKETLKPTTINLDASRGIVEAITTDYKTAYLSPSGIFANRAATQCVSSTTGCDQRAAIVGLGYGSLDKSEWASNIEQNLIAGVYGYAYNSGTAPSYGGYFHNLRALGLSLGVKYITSNTSATYLTDSSSLVVGFYSERCIVYLPAASREGQTIFFKQWWTGSLRITPRSGQVLYDDHTSNDYYDCTEGQQCVAHFIKASINGTNTEVWLISKYKF
jgi:hypothetical protein